jgi:hypothetical protein
MPSIEDRIREAHRELEALQTADHPARLEQKRQDYLDALHRERVGVAAKHAAALRRGSGREKIPSPIVRGEFVEGELTGYQAAHRLECQLQNIDAEIARVSQDSGGNAI